MIVIIIEENIRNKIRIIMSKSYVEPILKKIEDLSNHIEIMKEQIEKIRENLDSILENPVKLILNKYLSC